MLHSVDATVISGSTVGAVVVGGVVLVVVVDDSVVTSSEEVKSRYSKKLIDVHG